jgi:ethanolaminephosphotransferase
MFRSYRKGTGYNRTFYEAIRPLISPTILFISSTWWGFASPHNILKEHPRIFLAVVGTTFSNIAVRKSFFFIYINHFLYVILQCRLVVAQMTSTRSDGINTLLCLFVPIQIMSVYGLFNSKTEFALLFLYNAIATLAHLHYGICVVRQICNHLNIQAFKIPYRSQASPTVETHIKH